MVYIISALNFLLLIIYKGCTFLVSSLYDIIFNLAEINMFKNSAFETFKNNVTTLIGLFLIFKLAISVINYIVNPDKISDSKTGAKNIIVKLVIVISLLATIDKLFEWAYRVQEIILKDGIIENFVFSNTSKGDAPQNFVGQGKKFSTADYLAYVVTGPFFDYNRDAEIWGSGNEARALAEDECTDFLLMLNYNEEPPDSECCKKLDEEEDGACEKLKAGLKERDVIAAVIDIIGLKKDQQLMLQINPLGIIVALGTAIILVIIAVGVATRVFKLIFFQIIAPLPIILYIDPNSNGNSPFNKWLKATINTFLELFIRLFVLYFAILIISQVLTGNGGTLQTFSGTAIKLFSPENAFLFIFLVIGLLLFASQAPKLIEDVLGIKGGAFMRDAKTTAAVAGGIAGVVGGTLAAGHYNSLGYMQNYRDTHDGKLGIKGALGGAGYALSGLAGGFGRNVWATAKQAKLSDGGISGLNLTSGFKISNGVIKDMGVKRNARLATYYEADGKTQSRVYNFMTAGFNERRHRFLEMAGIKDTTTSVGTATQGVKNRKREMEAAKRVYQQAQEQRQTEYELMGNVRDDIVNSSGVASDFMDKMTGMYTGNNAIETGEATMYAYDAVAHQIVELNTPKDLDRFDYNDYAANMNAMRQDLEYNLAHHKWDLTTMEIDDSGGHSLSQAEQMRHLADFDRDYMISEADFNRMKASAVSYNRSVGRVNTTRAEFEHREKVYNVSNKNLENVNKRFK